MIYETLGSYEQAMANYGPLDTLEGRRLQRENDLRNSETVKQLHESILRLEERVAVLEAVQPKPLAWPKIDPDRLAPLPDYGIPGEASFNRKAYEAHTERAIGDTWLGGV